MEGGKKQYSKGKLLNKKKSLAKGGGGGTINKSGGWLTPSGTGQKVQTSF